MWHNEEGLRRAQSSCSTRRGGMRFKARNAGSTAAGISSRRQ